MDFRNARLQVIDGYACMVRWEWKTEHVEVVGWPGKESGVDQLGIEGIYEPRLVAVRFAAPKHVVVLGDYRETFDIF